MPSRLARICVPLLLLGLCCCDQKDSQSRISCFFIHKGSGLQELGATLETHVRELNPGWKVVCENGPTEKAFATPYEGYFGENSFETMSWNLLDRGIAMTWDSGTKTIYLSCRSQGRSTP